MVSILFFFCGQFYDSRPKTVLCQKSCWYEEMPLVPGLDGALNEDCRCVNADPPREDPMYLNSCPFMLADVASL